jgi:uncharacterized protein YdiU (UPF0061 family)
VIKSLIDLAKTANYSLVRTLTPDPTATSDGEDHSPRQVKSGHFVPVNPEPIENPRYVIHSKTFFRELSLSDELARSEDFMAMFSGDLSQCPKPMLRLGWACGYALSIYGTEYVQQCPFKTGNGYGDGRAISIFEAILQGKRWEMQLKGGGRTPYCRGADGRAVLRSSVREFLAQEHMYGLGVPASRSLTLYTSETESVHRPWFNEGSHSMEPEVLIEEPVAISTRVAPSFLRVGQIELFGRRARKKEHPEALKELLDIVHHLMDREYPEIQRSELPTTQKILQLAKEFGTRLAYLVSNWVRVGYCQGNFNSDNCAAGGFTLDFGPFGFMDEFDPKYQSWTGGGLHFSFLNQPKAAEVNFNMFCRSLIPLLEHDLSAIEELERIINDFPKLMHHDMMNMWASKLGLKTFDPSLFEELVNLMLKTSVDYTIFFRELSSVPNHVSPLIESFYGPVSEEDELMDQWKKWHERWLSHIRTTNPKDLNATSEESSRSLSQLMKRVNPKYTLREWHLVPAYQEANRGNYTLIEELNDVMTNPYAEQSETVARKFYRKKPKELFKVAGISHVSCSS